MTAPATARQRARAELTAAIKDEAMRQVREGGAASLSLRAVTRSLGMVSSAIYRYFPSRDDLLTSLIIDAYDAVGAAAEEADARCRRDETFERFYATGQAVRAWAVANPHSYTLVYGSPVPGYEAPSTTIGPASRVTLVLIGILRECAREGSVPAAEDISPKMLREAKRVAAEVMPEVPPELVLRGLMLWTQLFGMISFELFGHLVGAIEDNAAFFNQALVRMIHFATE